MLNAGKVAVASAFVLLCVLSVPMRVDAEPYGSGPYGAGDYNVGQVSSASSSSSEQTSSVSGGSGGGGRRGSPGRGGTAPALPTNDSNSSVSTDHPGRSSAGLSPEAANLLLMMRERLTERIERRILERPSVAAFLRRVLERLDARIAARLR